MTAPAIGGRRRLLSLEGATEQPDAAGGVRRSYGEIARAWCGVEPLSASDAMVAGATGQTLTHRVTLRWQADLTTAMRWRDGARVFEIVTVFDPDERRRLLVCLCREVRS